MSRMAFIPAAKNHFRGGSEEVWRQTARPARKCVAVGTFFRALHPLLPTGAAR